MHITFAWLKNVCAHHSILMVIHVVRLSVFFFFDSLFLALFFSVYLPYPLLCSFHLYLDPDLNLFLHVVDIRAVDHWHSANWWVWPLGRIHPSHSFSTLLFPGSFYKQVVLTRIEDGVLRRSTVSHPQRVCSSEHLDELATTPSGVSWIDSDESIPQLRPRCRTGVFHRQRHHRFSIVGPTRAALALLLDLFSVCLPLWWSLLDAAITQ